MGGKYSVGKFSSLLVSNVGLLIFLLIGVGASVIELTSLAGLGMFLFLLGFSSRVWGRFSISHVDIKITASSARMFRGNRTQILYTVKNDKLLPLIWLELIQELPWRRCVMPDGGFLIMENTDENESAGLFEMVLKKKFAFIMSRQSMTWTSDWVANRRGIYPIKELTLRSGDGFGLTQTEKTFPVAGIPTLVVYPDIFPVDVGIFLRTQWECTTGSKGHMEDISLMRGIRKYQTSDSWKRINWRMAARQQELQVNLYETILPKSAHFIIDGESFCGLSKDFSELEDMLSILASILLRLEDARLSCGLSLPASRTMGAVDLAAGGGTDVGDLLFYLSGYDCLAKPDLEHSPNRQEPVYFPSDFDWNGMRGATLLAGRIYYVTYSAEAIKSTGLPPGLDTSRLTLLTCTETTPETAIALDIPSIHLDTLRRR